MQFPNISTALLNTLVEWIDFSLAGITLIAIPLFVVFFVKRKMYSVPFFLLTAGILINFYFSGLSLFTVSLLIIMLIFVMIFIEFNLIDLKAVINGIFKNKDAVPSKVENVSKEGIYQEITEAVNYLAKTKTGAIITLERKQSLNDHLKNGIVINAPISAEMIMTIFHPGTRLHDGAIVVRENMILSASVYYTPSTKPMAGKFGSRHRAAIGISEVTDAVTVVVSEETGRISIAFGGELEPIFIDNFKKVLAHYMESAANG